MLGTRIASLRQNYGLSQAQLAQKLCTEKVELKFVPCMRMCAKGPNLKFDGKLYHQADEALLEKLLNGK